MPNKNGVVNFMDWHGSQLPHAPTDAARWFGKRHMVDFPGRTETPAVKGGFEPTIANAAQREGGTHMRTRGTGDTSLTVATTECHQFAPENAQGQGLVRF